MKKSKRFKIIIVCLAFLVLGISTIFFVKTKIVEKPLVKPVNTVVKNKVESSGEKLNVSIGSGEGSVDANIIIPVNFDEDCKKGVDACDFKVMYDPKVLEASTATYGDIVVAGNESFSTQIDNSIGVISFLFMDNNYGKQAILKKGVFSNITFKVKKQAAKGITIVGIKSIGAFVDEELHEHEVKFKDGSITIK